ncbi:MAG: hypothetical protein LUI87_12795 [Lachnospiraceae bacterium]|nr:hypothetical protein [Lachnospiraceae bacterium]
MKLMEKIFDGKVYPAEQVVPESPEYWKACKKTRKIMIQLEKKLEKEDYNMIEKMLDIDSIAQDCMNKAMFECGFSMGLLLMHEATTSRYIPRSYLADCFAGDETLLRPENTGPAKEEQNQ